MIGSARADRISTGTRVQIIDLLVQEYQVNNDKENQKTGQAKSTADEAESALKKIITSIQTYELVETVTEGLKD